MKPSTTLFVLAAVADFLDSCLHFFIAFALLRHLGHDMLAIPEKTSLGCAIVSTASAIVGEVLSLRIAKAEANSTSLHVSC